MDRGLTSSPSRTGTNWAASPAPIKAAEFGKQKRSGLLFKSQDKNFFVLLLSKLLVNNYLLVLTEVYLLAVQGPTPIGRPHPLDDESRQCSGCSDSNINCSCIFQMNPFKLSGAGAAGAAGSIGGSHHRRGLGAVQLVPVPGRRGN